METHADFSVGGDEHERAGAVTAVDDGKLAIFVFGSDDGEFFYRVALNADDNCLDVGVGGKEGAFGYGGKWRGFRWAFIILTPTLKGGDIGLSDTALRICVVNFFAPLEFG